MRKEIQEIIELSDRICARLDEAANDEKRMCVDMQMYLDHMKFDITRATSDLQVLSERLG